MIRPLIRGSVLKKLHNEGGATTEVWTALVVVRPRSQAEDLVFVSQCREKGSIWTRRMIEYLILEANDVTR